jgi:hypothetical protein
MRRTFRSLLSLALIILFSLYVVETESASSHTSLTTIHLAQETGGEVTEANWQQHPKIKQVRTVVQSVKADMGRKVLTTKKRAFEYCEPYEDTSRTIAVDAKGRARFYEMEGGSEDSSLKMEHYYDGRGRLRFVFITGGATNGSELEHRIYFDETGKRIWEKQTYKKGPGYTFPTVWPEDQLQMKDAATKFASKSPCPEERAGQKGKRTASN